MCFIVFQVFSYFVIYLHVFSLMMGTDSRSHFGARCHLYSKKLQQCVSFARGASDVLITHTVPPSLARARWWSCADIAPAPSLSLFTVPLATLGAAALACGSDSRLLVRPCYIGWIWIQNTITIRNCFQGAVSAKPASQALEKQTNDKRSTLVMPR